MPERIKNESENKEESSKRKRSKVLFPKDSISDVIQVAEAIRDNNASEAYNRIDLAASLDLSPTSAHFRDLITSSNKYGLTQGSYIAEKISLTDLGIKIVSPTSDTEKSEGLLEVLFNIEFYKLFFKKFNNNKLPRKDLLLNTLEREYGVSKNDREICYELIIKNATELGLLKDIKGTLYVRVDPAAKASAESNEIIDNTNEMLNPSEEAEVDNPPNIVPDVKTNESATTQKPIVFISHSKNMKILNQIKSNLEFGGFSYQVAIESETTAIPIPEKIFGMMRNCNCAIVNISADEEEKREDDSFSINANVLVEIGAAFLAYNQRVILLVDKRLNLPSNLQGLVRCEYEGEILDVNAVTKLQKGLLQFRVPVN